MTHGGARVQRSDRRPGERALAGALAFSALVHLVIFGLRIEFSGAAADALHVATERATTDAMRVIDIAVGRDAPPPVPIDVATRNTAPERAVAEPDAARTTAMPQSRAPSPSVADRLSTRLLDGRLGVTATAAEPLDPVRARVRTQLDSYNDSVAAAVEAERAASDWTRTRADGGRWGFSPDTIHMGGRTIVLRKCPEGGCTEPFFVPAPGRRDEQRDRVRTFHELRQQASRGEQQKVFAARVHAIREREQARRDSSRTGGG